MTVNSNGDYEALAKLLYPSIEASGNVYYGQTRKLTLDEVFDKNNGGFESHIESRKIADDSADYGFKYEKFFCWNLGPLSGELNIKNLSNTISDYNVNEVEVVNFYKELPNYWLCTPGYTHSPATEPHIDNVTSAQGVIFAKYTINISVDSVSNVINSGVYSTYEKSFVCNFQNYCLTNFYSPSNTNNWNVWNNDFFVDCTTDVVYLYIKLHSYFDSGYGTEIYDYPIQYSEPLTLTAVGGYVNLNIYNLCNNISQSRLYSYRINNRQWQNLQFYNGYASVTLQTNDRLQLYCRNFGEYSVHYTNNYTFSISANDSSSGYLIASGDARSVCTHFGDTSNISPNGIYLAGNCYLVNLFTNNTRLIAPPLLPSFKVWATYDTSSYKCYALMFRGCTNLKSAPELPGVTVDEYAYRDMFYGCTSLQNTPVLHHSVSGFTFNQTTYLGMFNGCANLSAATAFFNVDEVIDIQDFLTDVSSSGVLTTNATWHSGSIPIGWAINTVDYYSVNEEIAPLPGKNNKLITSGSSLSDISYGRGDVTDISTKYSMLTKNPLSDENAPEMNSYSSDGSYNQDIFGWKCFNSPVSFRNGIYGECGYVTTFSDSTYHGIKIETYDIGDDSNQSKIIIKADHIKLDGDVDDLTADKANKLVYTNGSATTTIITANTASSVIPNTNGTVSLGSSTNKFNKIYSDISLNTSLSFTTQYAVNGADQSEAFTTNLTDPNIAIKLPKRTYITTINNDNVEYVGRGQTNNGINLPENETTYLEVNRVAPGVGNAELCCIGTSTYKYGNVWANNLHGVVPHVDLTNTDASVDIKYPIGCIIKAKVSLSAFSNVTARKLPAGTESIRPGTGTIYEMLYDAYNETYITDSTTNLNSVSWKTLISVTRSQGDIELNKTFDIYIIRVG